MNKNHIKYLIHKFLTREISATEMHELEKWMNIPENRRVFEKYVRLHHLANINYQKFDAEEAHKKADTYIWENEKRARKSKRLSLIKYAAVFIGITALFYLYQKPFHSGDSDIKPAIPDKAITLQLDNGKTEIITSGEQHRITDKKGEVIGIQTGDTLNYTGKTTPEELVYNELHIPFGKRFQLVLSDGTKVFLNSGTSLRYPVAFVKGENRQVFLKGEAFFEVAKDSSHPFIVGTEKVNVRVLGTRFNVSAYAEDEMTRTVLVEGSVSLYDNKNTGGSFPLVPGQKAAWHGSDKEPEITAVDTSVYTAWKEGKLFFEKESFTEILKRLERHYDVSITNNNKQLGRERFTSSFDTESIEEVLTAFSKGYHFEYTITGHQIIIN